MESAWKKIATEGDGHSSLSASPAVAGDGASPSTKNVASADHSPSAKEPVAAKLRSLTGELKRAAALNRERAEKFKKLFASACRCNLQVAKQSSLDTVALHALIMKGSNPEALLRGVGPDQQQELLAVIQSVNVDGNPSVEVRNVPLGAFAEPCWHQAIPQAALSPLLRVGPEGGRGPSDDFALGVVVGPSGSGVTQRLLRMAHDLELPPAPVVQFHSNKAVAYYFHDAVSTLPIAGLNAVPAWVRPYHVLSNGQQQRVRLALYLAETGVRNGVVIDDLGSGIGAQERQSVAHAVGKFVRREGLKRVLIGTHSPDLVAFLQPDFVVSVDGRWSVNPNPPSVSTAVCLKPLSMGKLAQPEDREHSGIPDPGPCQYQSSSRWAEAQVVRVGRRALSITVAKDKRTMEAAEAFEFNFDGTAKCNIPLLPDERIPAKWFVGLIVGPSGTGKTTSMRDLCARQGLEVSEDCCFLGDTIQVLDCVSAVANTGSALGSKAAAMLLRACQVPSECWNRQRGNLSRSEAWRCHLACSLAASQKRGFSDVVVVDEFTTQLDRKHARQLCESLANFVLAQGARILCATVHEDVAEWLRPCWVFDTGRCEFAVFTRCQREAQPPSALAEDLPTVVHVSPADVSLWEPPVIQLDIQVVSDDCVGDLWEDHFKQHHYLAGSLRGMYGSKFVVRERVTGEFVAMHASSILPGSRTFIREHRLVVLPAWQGFGIGPRLSNFLAERWMRSEAGKGRDFNSKTAHPRLGELRQRDLQWVPTTSNLMPSKNGDDLGFERYRRAALAHGTVLSVRGKKAGSFRLVAVAPSVEMHGLGIYVPAGVVNLQSLGIAAGTSTRLLVDKNKFNFEDLEGSGTPWQILKINGSPVAAQDEAGPLGARWAHVDSLAVRICRYCVVGPFRQRQDEADADLEWMQARCAAQANLSREFENVVNLVNTLRTATPRPDSGELHLDILPELQEAMDECRPQRKSRVCYSHTFTLVPPTARERLARRWVRNDMFQAYARLRVPELRAEGRTHQASIEAAQLEFSWNAYAHCPSNAVAEFLWPEDEALEEPELLWDVLGMRLDDTGKVVDVSSEGPATLRGVRPMQQWVVAVRRGACKVECRLFFEAIRNLQVTKGRTFFVYLQSQAPC